MRSPVFFVAGLFAVLAACGPSQPAAGGASPEPAASSTRARNPVPVVVMLGDSLTAGYQLASDAALPDAVQRMLDDRGIKVKVVNAGGSGDTTADGLNRYDWSVAGQNPDLLIVALGANDFLQNIAPDVPARNLRAIIARAKATNLPVALLGVSVPDDVAVNDEREAAYKLLWRNVADAEGVPLLMDMLAPVHGKPELLLRDGVHPTEAGVEAMARPVADFIGPMVEALPH
jgi:acyl-CoA thioesterase-1